MCGDRDQTLTLHPSCPACSWLAANWSEAYQVLNLYAAALPARFARRDTTDETRLREEAGA